MNRLYIILNICTAFIIFVSCGGQDEIYQDFLSDSDKIILSKLEGIEAFSGNGRVKFVIPPQSDPRVTGVRFMWDNGIKTADFPLEVGQDSEIILDGISEGSHGFLIRALDDNGSTSLAVDVTVSSYADSFMASLSMAEVVSAARDAEGLCFFRFYHSPSVYYKYLELVYNGKDGKPKTVRLDKTIKSLYIDDLSGDGYSYRSVFLPEENSFEYVVSETIKVAKILPPQIEVGENVNLGYAKGYTIELPCKCTWDMTCTVDDKDKPWLSVSFSGRYLSVMALTRNTVRSSRAGSIILESGGVVKKITVTQLGMSPKLGTAYGKEGIIFWQNPNNPNEYKIISAAGNKMAWSTKNSLTNAKSYTGKTTINGIDYDNSILIRRMPDYGGNNTYALEWINALGIGWNMPSLNELKDELWPCYNGTVYEKSTKGNYSSATPDEKACRDRFESAMASIGGMKLSMNTGLGTCIMSNAEADASNQVAFRMCNSAIIQNSKTEAVNYARGVKTVIID